MLSILKKQPNAQQLEAALSEHRSELEQVQAAFKAERLRSDDLADQLSASLLDQSANAQSLEEQHAISHRKMQALAAAVERGSRAVAEAQRQITAELERDERSAIAGKLRASADKLAKIQAKLGPILELRAELRDSFHLKLVDYMPVNGTHTHRAFFNATEAFAPHLKLGTLDAFIDHLRAHADAIESGRASTDIGPLFHQMFPELAS
jgi:hypothetical protein